MRREWDLIAALVCWVIAWLLFALAAAQVADAGVKINRAETIAAQVWGNPCPSGAQVRWATAPATGDPNTVILAWTMPDAQPCVVWFNQDQPTTWQQFCSLMLHEYGHLAGYEHSDNPADIMYWAPRLDDPRCGDRP